MLVHRRTAVPLARPRRLTLPSSGPRRPSPQQARLRAALARAGLTPASALPPASAGRAEEACIQPARLLEHAELRAIDVGPPEPWPESVAFLDGTQRSEIVAYAGAAPLVLAEARAAVLERRERRLHLAVLCERRMLLGRREALAAAGAALGALEAVPVDPEGPVHPVRDLVDIGQALDEVRGALEREARAAYRDRSDAWLVVDGSLAESPVAAADLRTVAVSKSHATLPFEGEALERYLRLPHGHRSSLFEPASRRFAPVHAWALRLWPWEGRDLLHGLVRVEVAQANGVPETADRLSRWLMAERAPVSAPDRRWDRLLYGIHRVEEFLRSRES